MLKTARTNTEIAVALWQHNSIITTANHRHVAVWTFYGLWPSPSNGNLHSLQSGHVGAEVDFKRLILYDLALNGIITHEGGQARESWVLEDGKSSRLLQEERVQIASLLELGAFAAEFVGANCPPGS